jgi:hypothetical protein
VDALKNAEDALDVRLKKVAPNAKFDDQMAADLRAELAALAPALEEARKVASFPTGRYEVKFERNPYMTLLPHAQKARNVGSLLVLDVAMKTNEKNTAGALASFRALWNTGRSMDDEPFLISQLVRIALVNLSLDSLERLLARSTLKSEELQALALMLQQVEEEAPKLLYNAARMERASVGKMIELIANGELDLHQLEGGGQGGESFVERIISWPLVQPLARYGEAPTLEMMTRYMKDLRLPPAKRRQELESMERELKQMKADVHKNPEMVPALLLIPALTKVVQAFDREATTLACARVALAVERYRLAHNRWPDKLEDLLPTELTRIPDDPFGTGKLHYRRVPEGVVIYSVGIDGIDNQGAIDRENYYKKDTDIGYRLWDPDKRH